MTNKKVKIYNLFRDLNFPERIILSCKLIEGNIEKGDKLFFNEKNIIKIIDVEFNHNYNEVNLIIDEESFNEKFKLNNFLNIDVKIENR